MKHIRIFTLSLFTLLCFSCSEEEGSNFPSLVTEMVMAQADAEGRMTSFVTDAGVTYIVDNDVKGMDANSRVRCLCGYVMETVADGLSAGLHANVYSAQAVPILSDATGIKIVKHDPSGIQSAWCSGGYINLHLTPKTQGGKQAWAFLRDSTTLNVLGGTTYHLSIYHDQREDSPAYTTDLYACIALDSVATSRSPLDSIRLTVTTFKDTAHWQFGL